MGFAKNRAIELDDRGFGEVEGGVCLDHIRDECLRQRLEDAVTEHDCVVCDKALPSEMSAPFAVPLEELTDVVAETVRHFYSVASEVLPWDSEEHEFIGPQYETWPVVEEITDGAFDRAHGSSIVELISAAIGFENSWTP